MTTEEKPMCTYDCEQCGENYNDELYPDDIEKCLYCIDCRVLQNQKEIDAEVEENFGYAPPTAYFDSLLKERGKLLNEKEGKI